MVEGLAIKRFVIINLADPLGWSGILEGTEVVEGLAIKRFVIINLADPLGWSGILEGTEGLVGNRYCIEFR